MENEGLNILKTLIKDELDTVRIYAVESIMFKTFDSKVKPFHTKIQI